MNFGESFFLDPWNERIANGENIAWSQWLNKRP